MKNDDYYSGGLPISPIRVDGTGTSVSLFSESILSEVLGRITNGTNDQHTITGVKCADLLGGLLSCTYLPIDVFHFNFHFGDDLCRLAAYKESVVIGS